MWSQLEAQLGASLPGYYIHQIAQYLRYKNNEKLKNYGITSQQAKLLAHIVYHQQDASFCQKTLEEELDLRGSSITSLLHGLERGGFIRRVAETQDGRKKKILITEKGKEMFHCSGKILLEVEQELTKDLTPEEAEELYRLLRKMEKTKGDLPPHV